MRKSGVWMVFGLALAGLLVVSAAQDGQARPQYLNQGAKVTEGEAPGLATMYPSIADEVKTKKCNVCHIGATDKKTRNDFGIALHKALGGKDLAKDKTNERDIAKIKAALKKIEAEKSSVAGKTFGDLIKEGKLPGKNP